MSDKTKIQWCDSTVNPIMGCGGCELFPSPRNVLAAVDEAVAVAVAGVKITSKRIFKGLVDEAFKSIEKSLPGHKKTVNTTNIWHLRKPFVECVRKDYGSKAAKVAGRSIQKAVSCYAAILHLNKGASILKPDYQPKTGYAPIFETVTTYEGRMNDAARRAELLGMSNPATPWKDRLPRMIFVSDMGDALSAKGDFPFLKRELVPAFQSDEGKRHLWLWLTKPPSAPRKKQILAIKLLQIWPGQSGE